MLIKNKKLLNDLIVGLDKVVSERRDVLFELNKRITMDTNHWILKDYKIIKSYLKNYIKNYYFIKPINIKPKGKILIILSYNEPFILSIIPVLNALVAGNDVILKPSRAAKNFIKIIWQKSGLLKKYGLKLKIISPKNNEIEDFIKSVQAVYFFGSYEVAKNIAKLCGKYYVEFYPEIEASDVKIFNKNSSNIKKDALLTIKESFTHSGQSCQRIQGIFVHKDLYDNYVKILQQEFIKLCNSKNLNKFINSSYIFSREKLFKSLLLDITQSKPEEIIKINDLPLLVIKPKINSEFTKNAYFLPVLWIAPFNCTKKLIKILNLRKFFLGINIQSNDIRFINEIINNTKFTRHTINTSHTNIRLKEGWGGSWPSGFRGYKSWLEHFSNNYVVINKN